MFLRVARRPGVAARVAAVVPAEDSSPAGEELVGLLCLLVSIPVVAVGAGAVRLSRLPRSALRSYRRPMIRVPVGSK
jgi:hypothetical protein